MRFHSLIAFAALATIPASAATFNAVTDFSLSGNPNGVWSYGKGTANASFALLETSGTLPNPYLGVVYWASNTFDTPGLGHYPRILRNPTGSDIVVGTYTIYADSLEMHPGPGLDSILRFIAPTSGSYTFTGDFRGSQGQYLNNLGNTVAGTTTRVGIFAANLEVLTMTSINGPQTVTIDFTRNLAAGETVLFYVNGGVNGDVIGDSTALRLQVRSVDNASGIPEPSSMLLIASGVIAFAKLRRRSGLPA